MTLPPAARRRTGRTRRSYHIRARRLPRRGQRAQAAMGCAVSFRPATLLCMDHRRLKPVFNTLLKTYFAARRGGWAHDTPTVDMDRPPMKTSGLQGVYCTAHG
jgi:hypothetical protein